MGPMDRQSRGRLERVIEGTRFAVLVAAALLAGHDAVYLLHHGIGPGFASAMRDGGHDGYWGTYSIVVVIAAGMVSLAAATRLVALASRSTPLHRGSRARAVPSYRRELIRLGVRLVPAVIAGYLLQENVEHLLAEGHVAGIEPLIGAHPLAVPCLLLVAISVAAVGALVRWHIRVLAAHAGAPHQITRRRPRRPSALAAWTLGAALRASRWLDLRPEAGRAPPTLALPAHC